MRTLYVLSCCIMGSCCHYLVNLLERPLDYENDNRDSDVSTLFSHEHQSQGQKIVSYASFSDIDDIIADILDDGDEDGVLETLFHNIEADRTATTTDGFGGNMHNLGTIQRGPDSWYKNCVVPHPRYPFLAIFRISLHL